MDYQTKSFSGGKATKKAIIRWLIYVF